MKKLILTIATILVTMSSFAQNYQNYQNNITVNGMHTYNMAPEYSSKMIVGLNNVYYDAQTMSLDEVKSGYLSRLTKAGIDTNRLKEDNLYYALLGYEKEGTILVFKSTSLAEMKKFLSVKSIGVTRSDTSYDLELSNDQISEYSKAAFENAKTKATAIADKIGRKIGKAVYITDSNTNKISESVYYNYSNAKETRDYHISVSFELL